MVFRSRCFSIAGNGLRLCVCLPLAQGFNLTTNFMGQIAQNRCYKLAAVNYKTKIKYESINNTRGKPNGNGSIFERWTRCL